MKTIFSLFNLAIAILSLWVALDIFQGISHHPSSAVAGLVVLAVGATCLWLAKESIFSRQPQGL
jgi:hypothetical protein